MSEIDLLNASVSEANKLVSNWVDYSILFVLAISIFLGFIRGFIKEAVSLGFLLGAIFGGVHWADSVSVYFTPWIRMSSLRWGIGFSCICFVILLTGIFFGYVLEQFVKNSPFSMMDKLLGVVFGAVRGGLVICVILFIYETYIEPPATNVPEKNQALHLREKGLSHYFFGFLDLLKEQVGSDFLERFSVEKESNEKNVSLFTYKT